MNIYLYDSKSEAMHHASRGWCEAWGHACGGTGLPTKVHCGSQGVNMPRCTPVIPQQSPLSSPFVALERRHGAASKWSSLGRRHSTTTTCSTSGRWQHDDSGSKESWKGGNRNSVDGKQTIKLSSSRSRCSKIHWWIIWLFGAWDVDWFPQTDQKVQDRYHHGIPVNPVEIIKSRLFFSIAALIIHEVLPTRSCTHAILTPMAPIRLQKWV